MVAVVAVAVDDVVVVIGVVLVNELPGLVLDGPSGCARAFARTCTATCTRNHIPLNSPGPLCRAALLAVLINVFARTQRYREAILQFSLRPCMYRWVFPMCSHEYGSRRHSSGVLEGWKGGNRAASSESDVGVCVCITAAVHCLCIIRAHVRETMRCRSRRSTHHIIVNPAKHLSTI